jgi:hypothetical protein
MRAGLIVLGVLLFIAGAIWTAQGLNLPMAPRSFMTSDRTWLVIGLVTAITGASLAIWSSRRA